MAYIQRMLSKKVVADKSMVIFRVVFDRKSKMHYKTGICIKPEFWSEKTNDIRAITKASKYPPAVLREIRSSSAELDELEDTILYIIGEFPNLVGTKVVVTGNDSNSTAEKYWFEVALECVADIERSEWNKDVIEEMMQKRLNPISNGEIQQRISIYE